MDELFFFSKIDDIWILHQHFIFLHIIHMLEYIFINK